MIDSVCTQFFECVKYTKHFYRQEGLLLELTRKVEMEGELSMEKKVLEVGREEGGRSCRQTRTRVGKMMLPAPTTTAPASWSWRP